MKNLYKIVFGLALLFITTKVNAVAAPITYQTHVQDIGWQNPVSEGSISGTSGQSKRLEAIIINNNTGLTGDIIYKTHVQDIGWQTEVKNGETAGTSGQSKRLEAISINLTGVLSETYDIYYRVHVENFGWLDYAKNGEYAGTAGYAYRMEAIEIKLVNKNEPAPGNTINKYHEKQPSISYQTHLQGYGWQGVVGDSSISGTIGQNRRMEAIKIYLDNGVMAGNVVYQTHVQDIGWTSWTSNPNMSGTSGQSKRVEAIRISLTGDIANYYDIYYRVHVENFGWLDYAKNGESSGTAGYGFKMEAIEIKLIKKGNQAPLNVTDKYHEKQPSISYQTHLQGYGWQGVVGDSSISGTTNQNRRMEAIKIYLDNGALGGNVVYQTHVQDIGWTSWTSNPNMSGTSGQSKRLEAIKIGLTGDIANYYDIYYQAYIENIGWTGYNRNGEAVGSEGYSYRLEAIEIKLVKKGNQAPTLSDNTLFVKPMFIWYYDNGVKTLTHTKTGLVGRNVKKIIDISEHQGSIDWNRVKRESGIDGVILRVGFGSFTEDSKLAYNISELKRLGIPYGIYIFSYAENDVEANNEATGVLNMITKYSINPSLGVYYDLEDWTLYNANSYSITKETYESMSNIFLSRIRTSGYNAGIYTGVTFSNNRLNLNTRANVNWVAQYYSKCEYVGNYRMWQYASDGYIPGINTRVDMNVMFY